MLHLALLKFWCTPSLYVLVFCHTKTLGARLKNSSRLWIANRLISSWIVSTPGLTAKSNPCKYLQSISTIWVVFNLPENRCRFTQCTILLCSIYQVYTNRRKYFPNNKSTTKEWRLFWHLCARIRFAFRGRTDKDSCKNISVIWENMRVQRLCSTDETRLEYQNNRFDLHKKGLH